VKEVTNVEVAETVAAIVAETGMDFVYRSPVGNGICQYLHGTQPGCLVGHVLIRLGAITGELALQEGNTADGLDYGAMGLSLPSAALEALYEAQAVQDDERPWGEALEAFQATLERLSATQNA
jgi:hypothetical protein